MAGKQRTIRVEDDLWIQLQNIAAIQNTTCTDLINEDIQARVANTVVPDLKAKIDRAVDDCLSNTIEDSLINAIADRVFERLVQKNRNLLPFKTVETIEASTDDLKAEIVKADIDNEEPASWSEYVSQEQEVFYPTEDKDISFDELNKQTVETVETVENDNKEFVPTLTKTVKTVENNQDEKTVETVETVKNKNDEIIANIVETVETVETVKNTKLSKEEKIAANLAKFKQYRSIDNRKGYSDSFVAGQEGLSKATINRYRKGERSPKQDFIDRWGLSWNGNEWIKNLDDEQA